VRWKFTCRICEKILQPAAPLGVLSRGFAGPSLLAMIVSKSTASINRSIVQSDRYAREGVNLSVSTLATRLPAAPALASDSRSNL